MKLYVASSWRNDFQPTVVKALRAAGHEVYDFRNPRPGDNGFSWAEVDPEWTRWDVAGYRKAIVHPLAQAGFTSDFDAMKWANACVLVLPCGRSAHLEAGWFTGQGKPLIVLAPPAMTIEPELMYLLGGDCVRDSLADVIEWCADLQRGVW